MCRGQRSTPKQILHVSDWLSLLKWVYNTVPIAALKLFLKRRLRSYIHFFQNGIKKNQIIHMKIFHTHISFIYPIFTRKF